MKSILVLVVILHLCYSFNKDLNGEMITELTTLKHQLRTIKYTPPIIYVPSLNMSRNSHLCAGVFFRDLRVMLNNLLAEEKCTSTVENLLANLNSMNPLDLHDRCRMEQKTAKRLPIEIYIDFIRKLNI